MVWLHQTNSIKTNREDTDNQLVVGIGLDDGHDGEGDDESRYVKVSSARKLQTVSNRPSV